MSSVLDRVHRPQPQAASSPTIVIYLTIVTLIVG
jgi:hypothetical protein